MKIMTLAEPRRLWFIESLDSAVCDAHLAPFCRVCGLLLQAWTQTSRNPGDRYNKIVLPPWQLPMIAAFEPQGMTAEAYLLWEAQQEIRHEYLDGEIFAMGSGTLSHNDLSPSQPEV